MERNFDPSIGLEQQLGIRYKAEDIECAQQKILRVLSVNEGSPAEEADLKPKEDFILHCLNLDYFDLDHFAELTSEFHAKYPELSLKLVVYNCRFREMRIAILKPSTSWGGPGLVGAEFGTGIQNDLMQILRAANSSDLLHGQTKKQTIFTSGDQFNVAQTQGITSAEFANQIL